MKRITPLLLCLFLTALTLRAGQALADVHGGDIHYSDPVKGVLFSHDYHVEEMGMDCDMCHDDTFEMEALGAQAEPDFNMKALYQGRYCGACHDGETAFAAGSRCASCHEGVKGYWRATGLHAEEHAAH